MSFPPVTPSVSLFDFMLSHVSLAIKAERVHIIQIGQYQKREFEEGSMDCEQLRKSYIHLK